MQDLPLSMNKNEYSTQEAQPLTAASKETARISSKRLAGSPLDSKESDNEI
jgi:hypothetical protein